MKIAILGTKGIPNEYSGFEQCAELVSVGLVKRGHEVTVYNTQFHSYKKDEYKGVKIIRKYSPENVIGGSANFLYDYLCLRDACKRDFDIVLELGYASVAPFLTMFKNRPKIAVNMDGLEWKRSKWSPRVRKLMKDLEGMAVKKADYLIADNIGIQNYLKRTHGAESFYVPYSTHLFDSPDDSMLQEYGLQANGYHLVVARLEPENNTEMIIKGFLASSSKKDLVIVGNTNTKFGKYLAATYGDFGNVFFPGGIFNRFHLDNVRHFASLYFHGHCVGGTNPSLLEAMASNALVIAHDNEFNRNVLGEENLYFADEPELTNIFNNEGQWLAQKETIVASNRKLIAEQYTDEIIIDTYEKIFNHILKGEQPEKAKTMLTES